VLLTVSSSVYHWVTGDSVCHRPIVDVSVRVEWRQTLLSSHATQMCDGGADDDDGCDIEQWPFPREQSDARRPAEGPHSQSWIQRHHDVEWM